MNINLVAPYLVEYRELLASNTLGPEMTQWITEMVRAYEASREHRERLVVATSTRIRASRSRSNRVLSPRAPAGILAAGDHNVERTGQCLD